MANQSLLFNHPDTGRKISSIPDQEYVIGLENEYQIAVSETNKNVHLMKNNISSDQLITKMLLPGENVKSKSLYANILTKHDSTTNKEYERRYGVNMILSNLRMIVTDVDISNTPLLIKDNNLNNLKSFGIIDSWRVGHKVGENIYYQPINFSNIFSVTLDIQSGSEAIELFL